MVEEQKIQNIENRMGDIGESGFGLENSHSNVIGQNGHIPNESQYNLDETNESFSERKLQTNIPALKNNKNAMNKYGVGGANSKPFSERLMSGELKIDPNDLNAIAS